MIGSVSDYQVKRTKQEPRIPWKNVYRTFLSEKYSKRSLGKKSKKTFWRDCMVGAKISKTIEPGQSEAYKDKT